MTFTKVEVIMRCRRPRQRSDWDLLVKARSLFAALGLCALMGAPGAVAAHGPDQGPRAGIEPHALVIGLLQGRDREALQHGHPLAQRGDESAGRDLA